MTCFIKGIDNKTMPNYENGKIYSINCLTTGYIYIGSTVQTLKQRLREHKCKYKKFVDGEYHYITSFDCIMNENYIIKLIENCKCDSRKMLEKREGYWQKKIKCVNKFIMGYDEKQYLIDNKIMMSINRKRYYDKNKTILNSAIECECGSSHAYGGRYRHWRTKKHNKYFDDQITQLMNIEI